MAIATLKKIAQVANVTPYAVSVALRGKRGVSAETRQRIVKIARKLDYVPNFSARSLVSGRTGLVGVLNVGNIDDLSLFSSQLLLHQVERKLFAMGYQVVMGLTYGSAEYEYQCIQSFRARRVDAVILISGGQGVDGKLYRNYPCPIINVDHLHDGIECDRIRVDRSYGMFEATSHLLELGHRRIVLMVPERDDLCCRERITGYGRAYAEKEVEYNRDMILRMPDSVLSMDGIYQLVFKILETLKPTAIVGLNDFSSIAVIKAVEQRGLCVPADISVIGHDDILFAGYLNPPLTSIRQPYMQMATAIAEKVDQRVKKNGCDESFENVSMRGKLIIRKSTGPCRDGKAEMQSHECSNAENS